MSHGLSLLLYQNMSKSGHKLPSSREPESPPLKVVPTVFYLSDTEAMPEVFTVTWASLGEGAHEGSAKREVSVRPNGRDTRGHITGNQPELQHCSVSSCRGLTYQNRTRQHSLCPTMKRTKNLRALNSISPFSLVSISVSHWPEQERNQGKRSSRWVQRGVYVCPLNAECKSGRWEGKRQGTSQELLCL